MLAITKAAGPMVAGPIAQEPYKGREDGMGPVAQSQDIRVPERFMDQGYC